MFTKSSFKNTENKHDVYRGKDFKNVLQILKRVHNEDNQL